MLFGHLVGLWLVQAQPAPPDPAPLPAVPVEQPAGDAEGPAEAAPAEDDGPPAGPAEPAPPGEEALLLPEPPPHFLGFAFGVGRRLGAPAEQVPPAWGIAVRTILGRRYALVAERMALGLAFHFAYERYARNVEIAVAPNDANGTFEDIRKVSHYDFSLLHTASFELGPLRPHLLLGGGLGVGHFFSLEPLFRPGDFRALRPVIRGGGGVDVALPSAGTTVGLEVDYAWTFRKPTFTTEDGRMLEVFGDRLVASLWMRHAF
jgi:hypothetical protein